MTQKKALIVWGGWDGHTPDQSATAVKAMLERHEFDVRVENSTAAYADPAIHDLNLIVPMITMSTIQKDECENLCAAVRGGVGLGGFHGTMCDSFRNETEYQFMTGGQWVSHPGILLITGSILLSPMMPWFRELVILIITLSNIICMWTRPTKFWRSQLLQGNIARGQRAW